jgi:hypothetical protein
LIIVLIGIIILGITFTYWRNPSTKLTKEIIQNITSSSSENISITLPATVKQGEPMRINWAVKDAPKDSSIGLFLVQINQSERKFVGALSVAAQNMTSTATGTFNWDGQSSNFNKCLPPELPESCKGVDLGEYIIEAVIYKEKDARLVVYGFPRPDYKGPTILEKGYSPIFTITKK